MQMKFRPTGERKQTRTRKPLPDTGMALFGAVPIVLTSRRALRYSKNMAVLTIPKVLREKLSDDGADALVELLNKTSETGKQDIIALVGEKFERRLSDVKAELIKWMFIFWVGQIAVLTGIMVAVFKK